MYFVIFVLAECKDLIRKCLAMRPSDRPSLEEILEHAWMREGASEMDMEAAERCSLDSTSTSSRESI